MRQSNRVSKIIVDLEAIKSNLRAFQQNVGSSSRLMAVVKANAYGHGLLEMAWAAAEQGADWLGVALAEEAFALREGGLELPILVLGYSSPEDYPELIRLGIRPSIFSLIQGMEFAEAAAQQGCKAPIHLKIDTGMGRIGFAPDEGSIFQIKRLAELEHLELEGVFTHFPSADASDLTTTREQLERFSSYCQSLKKMGVKISLCHCANSAAAMRLPESHMDMVRIGIAMYGLSPSSGDWEWDGCLQPALSLHTKVIQVKEVPAGTGISYGQIFRTTRVSRIGTLPIGYGDGFPRGLSNKGTALVAGQKVPIIGRICMDQCMVDLTEVPHVKEGELVVLLGKQDQQCIPAEELADLLDSINYEIVTALSPRLPRVYV